MQIDFIKRPTVVQAMQFDGTNTEQLSVWMGIDVYLSQPTGFDSGQAPPLALFAGDGINWQLKPGDWAVGDSRGGFVAETDSSFKAKYLPMDAANQPERDELGLPSVLSIINDEGGTPIDMILWQNGPMPEGRNGVTCEEVLQAVIDRLQAFQKTKFSCRENSIAITCIETGLNWLEARTRRRQARGVEGKLVP